MNGNLNKFVFVWALGVTAFILMGVTIPNTFVPGTTIRAADVNANFNSLRVAVNALESPTRSGTMLAHCRIAADGTHTQAWTSTGGAITTTRIAAGDFVIEVAGQTLEYDRHMVTVNAVHIGNDYNTTIGSASSAGFPGGLRIRVWDQTGAAVDVQSVIAIFNP